MVASWAGVAVILWAAVTFDEHTVFPGAAILVPVAGALLALAGGSIAPKGGAEVVARAVAAAMDRQDVVRHLPVALAGDPAGGGVRSAGS